jgi:hypothetical protein
MKLIDKKQTRILFWMKNKNYFLVYIADRIFKTMVLLKEIPEGIWGKME